MNDLSKAITRIVSDQRGQTWHCYVVQEGLGWDAEMDVRRVNWLCCTSLSGRRYITPVPADWQKCDATVLAEAISAAAPDRRRFY